MKWAVGTLVLVLVLLAAGLFMANNAAAPGGDETKYAKDIYGESEDVDRPGPLVEIYKGISVSENVTTLDLSNRNLTGSLKAEVRKLSALEEMNLSGNSFTGLPAEVGQLTKLRVLNLSNNNFTGLPHELGNLNNLETLDVSGNDVSETDLEIITSSLPASVFVKTSAGVETKQEDTSEESTDSADSAEDEAVFCTMDAKLCPDGSYVSRQGPNCEFAPCPE